MRAQRRRRDLQLAAAPGDAVVVADDALLLDREDVAPERLGDHHERRGRLLGRDREGPVVLGQVDLAQEPVGGLDGGDPGQRQLLGQAVLQRPEGALAAAPGLGRIGFYLAASLWGEEVMAAARLVPAPTSVVGAERRAV